VFYSTLAVVDIYMMTKAIRLGPTIGEPRSPAAITPAPLPVAAE
jgi:hypothetical protein